MLTQWSMPEIICLRMALESKAKRSFVTSR